MAECPTHGVPLDRHGECGYCEAAIRRAELRESEATASWGVWGEEEDDRYDDGNCHEPAR